MSQIDSDISRQVKEVYGVDVIEGTVSNVTNRIIEHVKEWLFDEEIKKH